MSGYRVVSITGKIMNVRDGNFGGNWHWDVSEMGLGAALEKHHREMVERRRRCDMAQRFIDEFNIVSQSVAVSPTTFFTRSIRDLDIYHECPIPIEHWDRFTDSSGRSVLTIQPYVSWDGLKEKFQMAREWAETYDVDVYVRPDLSWYYPCTYNGGDSPNALLFIFVKRRGRRFMNGKN